LSREHRPGGQIRHEGEINVGLKARAMKRNKRPSQKQEKKKKKENKAGKKPAS